MNMTKRSTVSLFAVRIHAHSDVLTVLGNNLALSNTVLLPTTELTQEEPPSPPPVNAELCSHVHRHSTQTAYMRRFSTVDAGLWLCHHYLPCFIQIIFY